MSYERSIQEFKQIPCSNIQNGQASILKKYTRGVLAWELCIESECCIQYLQQENYDSKQKISLQIFISPSNKKQIFCNIKLYFGFKKNCVYFMKHLKLLQLNILLFEKIHPYFTLHDEYTLLTRTFSQLQLLAKRILVYYQLIFYPVPNVNLPITAYLSVYKIYIIPKCNADFNQ